MNIIIYILCFICLSYLSTAESHADIYKCISDKGEVVFKNSPCDEGSDQEIIKSKKTKNKNDYSDSEYDYESELPNEIAEESSIKLEIINDGYQFTQGELNYLNHGVNFLYNYYKQIFEYEGEVLIRMRVIGDEKDFYNYQIKNIKRVFSKAGIFINKLDEGVINGSMSRKKVIRTLLHETSHAILSKKTRNVPLWINEGLAEYFEMIKPYKNEIVVDYQYSRYFDLRKWQSGGQLIPLGKYLRLNSYGWRELEVVHDQITRTMAWSIIHFLMSSESGQKSLVKIIRKLKAHPDIQSVKIINKNVPGGISRLEREWAKYISSSPTIHTYQPF
ncbi:MAG: DUF1570 domain-containing protein [Candidatus Dadabacteria bacterium]|nr:DUF1570 domain-containing protein [Candidatus Dadabacteria bacterium]NIQ15773.1 DUF1570 domain-containing protein [Candidatus Dadabacteria bacterium]